MDSADHRNEADRLGEASKFFGEGGQMDLYLEASFLEIRSKGSGLEPDWISFEKRLLSIVTVEHKAKQQKRRLDKQSFWQKFQWPALLLGGLAACLLFVPFVWKNEFQEPQSFQRDEKWDEKAPLSSGIPLARDEELERESEADDMAAELLGVSADAFLYGEKNEDDIEWKPIEPSSSSKYSKEGKFSATAPSEELPDAPSDAPEPPSIPAQKEPPNLPK